MGMAEVRQFARDGNTFPIANAFLLNRRIAMKQAEQLSSAWKNPRAWRKRESVYNAELLRSPNSRNRVCIGFFPELRGNRWPWRKIKPSAALGKTLAWKGETGRVDDLVRKYCDLWGLRPDTTTAYLCGIPACARTGKASSNVPAGRRVPCSKRFISSQAKKRPPSSAAQTRVDFSQGRCTMRPGQNPNHTLSS
jgi:hypothetical protein